MGDRLTGDIVSSISSRVIFSLYSNISVVSSQPRYPSASVVAQVTPEPGPPGNLFQIPGIHQRTHKFPAQVPGKLFSTKWMRLLESNCGMRIQSERFDAPTEECISARGEPPGMSGIPFMHSEGTPHWG